MKTAGFRSVCGAVVMLTMATVTQSQQDTQPKPLGDVARDLQAHKPVKTAAGGMVHPESGMFSTALPADAAGLARRSVFDQLSSKKPEFIMVPAGTEIRVDIIDGKVIVPVRVGFATPVPALSRAAVRVNQVYYAPVSYNMGPAPSVAVFYGESAELTSVTVNGVTYPVQARPVSLSGAALGSTTSLSSSRDAVFVLNAPLAIER